MSAKSRCRVQHFRVKRGVILVALLPAMIAGGCAEQPQYQQANWYAGGPRPVAAAVPVPVEMEDDGRPAQLPPRAEATRLPDDPREPWSPNYGGPALKPQHVAPQEPRQADGGTQPAGVAHRVAWSSDPQR